MPGCKDTPAVRDLRDAKPGHGKTDFFEANALPFGASAAVHGFNRAAMALECVCALAFFCMFLHSA